MLVKCKNLLKYILFGWLLLKYLLLEFVSSIISSYVTLELPIILLHIYHFCNYILHDSKHNRFLTFNFIFFIFTFTATLTVIPTFDSIYIFYYQTCIHICMIYILLMFLIRLFLLPY